ncbi:unnamed protein product [Orchesella dallaii]|uniref:Gustatory receptor n=1 Tax=Orchesella dallaii TaxID=48710 RepID=A0ABP1S198_9HEXA
MLLSSSARFGFHSFVSFLCITKLIPYCWNRKRCQLTHAKGFGLFIFHLHSTITFILCLAVNYRVFRAYLGTDKKYALVQKVLGVFGAAGHAITALAFLQLELQPVELMDLCNRVLSNLEKEIPRLFVMVTNIPIHATIPAASPCAPHLITSFYLDCKTYEQTGVPADQLFFLLFPDIYTMTKFLIMNCFFWTFLITGLGIIRNGYKDLKDSQTDRIVAYRSVQLFGQILNGSLWFYLSFFSHILFFIMSLLLFGTIRLWKVDPRVSLSFPGCGFRCLYEVLSPTIIAGKVDTASGNVLSDLKDVVTQIAVNKKGMRKSNRILAKISLDGVVETTFDLLVTFKDETV